MGKTQQKSQYIIWITVENINGIELPATGDMGTKIFSVVDGMLIIGSTITIIAIQHNHNISIL